MTATPDPIARLRQCSAEEMAQTGEHSLREHLLAQAIVAHQKYAPFTFATLDPFLNDRDCVRYPTRLAFEFGEMALHQFAQPDLDFRNIDQQGHILYLRPVLRQRPDLVVRAVAYMIPVLNYGDIATDNHCLKYGATLLGLIEPEFYEQICAVADYVNAEKRYLP